MKLWIIPITLIGGALRFYQLGELPLWIDEALFGFWVKGDTTQEFIPVYLAKIVGAESEYWLRFFSALCGTLTIPAIFWVIKDKKMALLAAGVVAVFPLFVFWSRMARPYSIAGLFMVLSWRYWWMIIPAILSTPISLIGFKLKQKKWILFIVALSAVGLYLIRDDATREWTFNQFLHSPRWWYLPSLAAVIYLFSIKHNILYALAALLIFYSASQLQPLLENKDAWYRQEVRFSDWRETGHVQFSTNAVVTNWYSNIDSLDLKVINRNPWFDIKGTDEANYSRYFRDAYFDMFDSLVLAGDTVTLGLDYYALFSLSAKHLPIKYLTSIQSRLLNGEVVRVKFYIKDSTKLFLREY